MTPTCGPLLSKSFIVTFLIYFFISLQNYAFAQLNMTNKYIFILHVLCILIGCGGVSFEDSGSILSPNYPHAYAQSSKCTWVIHAKEEEVVILHVNDFQIEDRFDSCPDSLKVCLQYIKYVYEHVNKVK